MFRKQNYVFLDKWFSLSYIYLKPIPHLELLLLRTRYRVQFDRCHDKLILNAYLNVIMYSVLLICFYDSSPVIYIFKFYLALHTVLVVKFVAGLGKRVSHFMFTVCHKMR